MERAEQVLQMILYIQKTFGWGEEWPDIVGHTSNPRYLGGKGKRNLSSRAALTIYLVRRCLKIKTKKN